MTDMTTIRLETPILRPDIDRKEVKENTPPLLDLKDL